MTNIILWWFNSLRFSLAPRFSVVSNPADVFLSVSIHPIAKTIRFLSLWRGLSADILGKIGYLITPGVFERSQGWNYALCQPYPWEWSPFYTHKKKNQKQGCLVSMATEKPVAISCRMRPVAGKNSIPAHQVFAAPAGSVYYLQYSPSLTPDWKYENHALFQDSDLAPKDIKRWRSLGYSEILWISYD